MTISSNRWRYFKLISTFLLLKVAVMPIAYAQNSQPSAQPGLASVPSGPATNRVVQLTLREAITMAIRYNLGGIESAENMRIVRGERLHALSNLMPQLSLGISEDVEQLSAAVFGFRSALIPAVIGPFSYSTAQVNLSQTLFSFESIKRLRAARTAEQA